MVTIIWQSLGWNTTAELFDVTLTQNCSSGSSSIVSCLGLTLTQASVSPGCIVTVFGVLSKSCAVEREREREGERERKEGRDKGRVKERYIIIIMVNIIREAGFGAPGFRVGVNVNVMGRAVDMVAPPDNLIQTIAVSFSSTRTLGPVPLVLPPGTIVGTRNS